VLVLPRYVAFIELDAESLEIRDVEAFVVLLIGRPDHEFLLGVVNLNRVDLFWPLQITDSPFEAIYCVLPDEDRLLRLIIEGIHYLRKVLKGQLQG
jgi:hypothetical protein